MKNIKQLLAIIGIGLLAGMYVLTFILSLTDHSKTGSMLMASLYATVVIPVLLYAFMLVYKWTHPKDEEIPKISPETSKIDTLIFDLGNVLVKYDWKKLLKELGYDEKTSAAVAKAIFLSKEWEEADRGVLSENELLQRFISNAPDYEKEIRETFASIGKTISIYPYTKDWLSYFKKRGYKIYILSNFSKYVYDQCTKELDFLELVDGGYMSWQIHCIKPEPEFYQKLITDFEINPQKSVFIDDFMENIAEARALGFHAVHFTSKKNADRQLLDFGVK